MNTPFSKYSGSGNDFILIDNRTLFFPANQPSLVSHLCHRNYGIGADGIILLENSSSADFKMRIFNADGSEAEMCGNGIRCLLKFIIELGHQKQTYVIETMHRHLPVRIKDNHVCVQMGNPTDFKWNLSVASSFKEKMHYLNTGVPHLVLFVDDVYALNLYELGKELRYHEAFAPQGTNVNLASIDQNENVFIRTYERGVENETMACGTGATAVAIAAAKIKQLSVPVQVFTKSNEKLEIDFKISDHDVTDVTDVTMTGPANLTFKGFFNL